jgi:hypothetical protein
MEQIMATAVKFAEAFVAAYDEARKRCSPEDWSITWEKSWSQFMIWGWESVIRVVAPRLDLQCDPGEPLHLDAVFHTPGAGRPWFPIKVAVEHENNPHEFHEEIKKLLCIRCPLKVGITYTLTSDVGGKRSRLEGLRSEIARRIRDHFAEVNALIKEDPETEYLFLLGSEEERDREIQWHQLAFRAGRGPESGAFALCGVG